MTAGEHAGRVRGRLASYRPGAVYHTHRRPAAQLKQRRHAVGLILAIDPSSTRTGFAVLNARDGTLVDAGAITPSHRRDNEQQRCSDQVSALRDLLDGLPKKRDTVNIVIEVPSGHVRGDLRRRGAGGSLMIYALAVGELRRACADWCHDVGAELHCVRENEWTHGQRKATRRRALALTEPRYRAVAAQDRGADVADAIELGRWWIAKHANMDDRQ